jgi:hypothetical protein
VFKNKQAPTQIVFDRVKKEVPFWVLAGAKKIGPFDAARVVL